MFYFTRYKMGGRVEETGERGRVVGTECHEGGIAVVKDEADVGDVALEALGEAVALVVEGSDGEPERGEVDVAGQLRQGHSVGAAVAARPRRPGHGTCPTAAIAPADSRRCGR